MKAKDLTLSNQQQALEQKASALKSELDRLQREIRQWEQLVWDRLHPQIKLVQELKATIKAKKTVKKQKRLDQKRKGKNFDPNMPVPAPRKPQSKKAETGEEIKQLFRSSLKLVHPDRQEQDNEGALATAHSLTSRLNTLYAIQDLDGLREFYETLSQHAIQDVPRSNPGNSNRQTLLHVEITALQKEIEACKQSYFYQVMQEKQDVETWIAELRAYFEERIPVLQKRAK
jgi:HPt (histidine-containing phosphotransfer) domain-containing protein